MAVEIEDGCTPGDDGSEQRTLQNEVTAMPDYEGEYYDDEPPPPRAFCDRYEVHEPHVYSAINGRLYSCIGLSVDELAEMEAYDPGTCEHGLSADLCSGPMHY